MIETAMILLPIVTTIRSVLDDRADNLACMHQLEGIVDLSNGSTSLIISSILISAVEVPVHVARELRTAFYAADASRARRDR